MTYVIIQTISAIELSSYILRSLVEGLWLAPIQKYSKTVIADLYWTKYQGTCVTLDAHEVGEAGAVALAVAGGAHRAEVVASAHLGSKKKNNSYILLCFTSKIVNILGNIPIKHFFYFNKVNIYL